MGLEKEHSYIEDVHMAKFNQLAGDQEDDGEDMNEKTLTPAELKKREEVAKAIKRENPNMPMAKKMAIATATAKKVAEGVEDMASMGNRTLARIAGTIGHPQSAAAKNELAHRRMQNEERVISGGYRDQDGKYHPPKTATSIMKDRLAKKAAIMQKTATAMRKEEVELDESITRVSDAKLKFHAINGVPHGSYSKKEIAAEHDRRKKTGGSEYNAVKPSMNESADMSKLKILARAGLVDQKNVERLIAAFKMLEAGKVLSTQQKDLILSSYSELASIVTGDSMTFQKAKKAVAEAVELGD